MGSKANKKHSSASNTISMMANDVLAGFSGIDRQYRQSAKRAIDSVVESMGADLAHSDNQSAAIKSLTSKSVSLVSATARSVVADFAKDTISSATSSASVRADELDATAQSSATVAISYFSGSAYGEVSNYATPSEAASGMANFATSLDSAINNATFSSASRVVNDTADALYRKATALGSSASDVAHSALSSAVVAIVADINKHASDIDSAGSLAHSGTSYLNSLVNSVTVDSANHEVATTYHRFKDDLNQVSDSVAQSALGAIENVVAPAYESIKGNAFNPDSASHNAVSAVSAMNSIFTSYGHDLIAAGINEYTKAAHNNVDYLTGYDLANANSLVASAADSAFAAADNIDANASDAVNRFYSLIPVASAAIESVAHSVNASYADANLSAAATSAQSAVQRVSNDQQALATTQINQYLDQLRTQINGLLDQPELMRSTLRSGVNTVTSIADQAVQGDSYASAWQSVDSAAQAADDQLNLLSGDAYSNAASAVNRATTQAYKELDISKDNQTQLGRIGMQISTTIDQVINSYATSAAFDQLSQAADQADSMIDQLSNVADQSNAASTVAELHTTIKRSIQLSPDVQLTTNSGVAELKSTAYSLVANDPTVSAYYAVQSAFSSAADKAVYLNAAQRANADSEFNGVMVHASSAMNDDIGNANALTQDVANASGAMDEIVNRYNVNSAQSEMGSLAQSAHHQMRHIADSEVSTQASQAVVMIQDSLTATLNRASDRITTISLAMSSAYSSVDSITARYIGTDVAASAYASVDSIASAAYSDAARFNDHNRNNASSEVAKQIMNAEHNLASTHDHVQVARQANQTITSILNRYMFANAKATLNQIQADAIKRLTDLKITDDAAVAKIKAIIANSQTEIAKDAKSSAVVDLDLHNAHQKVSAVLSDTIDQNPVASAAVKLHSNAATLLSERSAANFDYANFSSAVNKTTHDAEHTAGLVDNDSAVEEITSLAIGENGSHFGSNVSASAMNGVAIAADDMKAQLNHFGLNLDVTIQTILDKYKGIIDADQQHPAFADLDRRNAEAELKRHLLDALNEQPKIAARYQIDQTVASASALMNQYIDDQLGFKRDVYRITSGLSDKLSAADDQTMASIAASANSGIAAVAHSHIASDALHQISAAASSANSQVATINDTSKLIDARNVINSTTNDGTSLVQADQAFPTVVATDVQNTSSALASLAAAAVSDDFVASATSTVASYADSAANRLSIYDQPSISYQSAVASLTDQLATELKTASNAEAFDPKLEAFTLELDTLTNRFVKTAVNAKIKSAMDAASKRLAVIENPSAAEPQLYAIASGINIELNNDIKNPALLNTDINNVLEDIEAFADQTIADDQKAIAATKVNASVQSANRMADEISGSIAANLNSEVAKAHSSYADQLATTTSVSEVTSHAIETIDDITGNYVEAYANDLINNAAQKIRHQASAYLGVDMNALENQLQGVVSDAAQTIQQDHHDLSLSLLDANNAIEKLYQILRSSVAANEVADQQYHIDRLKRSATAAAGQMDSLASANMSSALNHVVSVADGQPTVASAQMANVVNSYHASVAQSQVSAAANDAHKQVLQLSNVTKVSTSAAINSVVSSINAEISADQAQPSYTALDAQDGIKAIDTLLSSAVDKDSAASLASVATSLTNSAYARMGSMNESESLVAANQIQQLVDRAAGTSSPMPTLADKINTFANHYILDSAQAKLDSASTMVRNQLSTSDNRADAYSAIDESLTTAKNNVLKDIEKPAYLALDIENGLAQLNAIVDKYQTDLVAKQVTAIDGKADSLASLAVATGYADHANVSSAAASVARQFTSEAFAVGKQRQSLSSVAAAVDHKLATIKQSFVADSAISVMQAAVNSAAAYTGKIADHDYQQQLKTQINGVADSFKQLIQSDTNDLSLASLDANNAVLEINRIATQAVDNDQIASASYDIKNAADAVFSNANLMTSSQADNYASAIASVTDSFQADQLNGNDDQTITSFVGSVKAGLTSVANQYYGNWAHSAVSYATDSLLNEASRYNEEVRNRASQRAVKAQTDFNGQFALDSANADLIVLDAQNAVSAISSAASEAAYNDSIAFANSAISDQISSANSVLTDIMGRTDSTADMQMDSVANQANEKLGSVYSNLNAVMMVINSASSAMSTIANGVVASSARATVTSAADSLMSDATHLISDSNSQVTLISSIKDAADSLATQIDNHSNYPVTVSMETTSGLSTITSSAVNQFKQNAAASAEIALRDLSASAASHVGPLDSLASANFSSAVGSINARTSAFLSDQLDNPARVTDEIDYAGQEIDKLVTRAVADSAQQLIDTETAAVRSDMALIANDDQRSQATSTIKATITGANSMVNSDAFDYHLASLDASNAVATVHSIAAAAFSADSAASQALFNRAALASAHAKLGSLSSRQSTTFDSQIAALDANQPADYQAGLNSIANQFIKLSANAVVDQTVSSAADRAKAISDNNNKHSLLQMVSATAEQASAAIEMDANHSQFASLDANNAVSSVAALVNDAIERDPVASASVSIERAASSVTDRMTTLSADQHLRFNKQIEKITLNANVSLIGPFADKNNVISNAAAQMNSVANSYMLRSAYSAVNALASSANYQLRDLSANDSLNVKTKIDSAISSADSQISAHSMSTSLVADAVNAAANVVDNLTSTAVTDSPIAAAKSSLASVQSSATTIADSFTGRNAANFNSEIASVANSAISQFTADDATANQQALQNAAQVMRNTANFHAAKGAIAQVKQAATDAEHTIQRLADIQQRNDALTKVADQLDYYRTMIQNDTNNLALINLDVLNARKQFAAITKAAVQNDYVASAMAQLDHHASSMAVEAGDFTSLASANMSSAVNDINSQAAAAMHSVSDQPSSVVDAMNSAVSEMDALFEKNVVNSATAELANVRSAIDDRLSGINDSNFMDSLHNEMATIQAYTTKQILTDAYSQPFVQLDLSNAQSAFNRVTTSAVNNQPVASATYQVTSLVADASRRAANLTGSLAANFSSAVKSVARQANDAAAQHTDQHALDTITSATNQEINSTVSNYLTRSAYDHLQSTTSAANSAMQMVDDQTKLDATKEINTIASSVAQMISADASDDQLISLDVKEGNQSITSYADSVVASQPVASASSVINSTASFAMQRVQGLDSFAAANLSSAMNRFKKQATASLAVRGIDEPTVSGIQSSTVSSMNDIADSYVASSASQLISHATSSADAVIKQFNNETAASTASASIDRALNSVATAFAQDRDNAELMALDAANAIDSIHSAAQFITTTDEIVSGNIFLSNTADSAYAATAGLGETIKLNKQIHDVLTDANQHLGDGDNVDLVVNNATRDIKTFTTDFVMHAAEQQLSTLVSAADEQLSHLLNSDDYESAQENINNFVSHAKATLDKDSHDGELIKLDLMNIETQIDQLVQSLIQDQPQAVMLSEVASHASAAVQQQFSAANDDDYLNFSSAVNHVVSDFENNPDRNGNPIFKEQAFTDIHLLTQSYVASQAMDTVNRQVQSLDGQIKDLSNFVTQSSAYSAVHQIASNAEKSINSDIADFAAVSLDTDNAISSANTVLDQAVANDSIAAGKRVVSSAYASAASFATNLSRDDQIEFSLAVASQSASTSFGADADNSALASSATSAVTSMIDQYVVTYANNAIDNQAQVSIDNIKHITDPDRRSEYIGILNNVITDLKQNISSDSADATLVDVDVQNGINTLDSLADSMVRSEPGAAGQYIISSAANSALDSMAVGTQFDEANFTSAINSVANQASLSVSLVSKNLTLVNRAANSSSNRMNQLAIDYRESLAQVNLGSAYASAAQIAAQLSDADQKSTTNSELRSASQHYSSLISTDAYSAGYVDLDLRNGIDQFNTTIKTATLSDPTVATSLALAQTVSEEASRLAHLPTSAGANFASAATSAASQTNGLVSYAASDAPLVSTATSSTTSLLAKLADDYLVDAAKSTIASVTDNATERLSLFADQSVRSDVQNGLDSIQSAALDTIAADATNDDLLALDIRNVQRNLDSLVDEAISHDIYATANQHVKSVADSLIASTVIDNDHEALRMQLEMQRIADKATSDITSAGMNNDLINATVDSTAAVMNSVANQFAVSDAHQHIASLASSVNAELSGIDQASAADQSTTVERLTNSLNQQIDQYQHDRDARGLVLRKGQAQLDSLASSVINAAPKAFASSAVASFAAANGQIGAALSGSNQANFTSEVAALKQNADANVQRLVVDSQAANDLIDSAAEQFSQVARKYVANAGYASLNAAVSATTQQLNRFGLVDDDVNATMNGIIREFNSMVDSDADNYATVRLDCQNASHTMQQFVDDVTAGNQVASDKLALQSVADSATNSIGSISDSRAAANFSSAVNSVISHAYSATDQSVTNNDSIAAQLSSVQNDITQIADRYVNSSANAENDQAFSSASQLTMSLAAGDEVNASLSSVHNSYRNLINKDFKVSAFASLDADNASMALAKLALSAVNAQPQAAVQYQIERFAAQTSAVAKQFDADDQIRFSSAVAQVVSSAAQLSVTEPQQVSATAASVMHQIDSIANHFIGKRAIEHVDQVAASASQRVALLHNDAANAVLKSAMAHATNQIISNSANSMATSLYAYDGITAANSYADSLIADQPFASAVDSLNQLVDATTRDVLMSDSLADMNFLSAVAKTSKQAVSQMRADDSVVDHAGIAASAATAITSIAHQYTNDSASELINQAATSAMTMINGIKNNVARSQAANWINNETSAASEVIAKDVANDSLIALDIDNGRLAIQSVVDQALADDASVAFSRLMTSAAASASAQTAALTGSLAANYDSDFARVTKSLQAANTSLTDVNASVVASVNDTISSVTSKYVEKSADAMIDSFAADIQQQVQLADNEQQQVQFIANRAKQFIQNDAHDHKLAALDATNAIGQLVGVRDTALAQNPAAALDLQLISQASSASAKVGKMDTHSAANFSSAADRIANGTKTQIATFSNHDVAIASAASAMNSLANDYILDSAVKSLGSIVDSANAKTAMVASYASAEQAISSAASVTSAAIVANQNESDVVALLLDEVASQANYIAINAINADPKASALASIDQTADSLLSDAELSGHAKHSYASVHASIASSASYELISSVDTVQVVTDAKQALVQAASRFVMQTANEIVNKALDIANNQAVEIDDIHSRNQTISAIGAETSKARKLIQQDGYNSFFAYLDAQNAAVKIAKVTQRAVKSDAVASAIIAVAKAADDVVAKLKPLIDPNEEFRLNNRILNIVDQTNRSISAAAGNADTIGQRASSANAEFNSIANSYVANSANSIVSSVTDSASIQVEGLDNQLVRNDVNERVNVIATTASDQIHDDAANVAYASLDADNASLAISSVVASAVASDPYASANAVISSQIASAAADVDGMNEDKQSAFSNAILQVVGSANMQFMSAANDTSAIATITANTVDQLHTVARDFVVTSAQSVINGAASDASRILDSMFDNSNATVYSSVANVVTEAMNAVASDSSNFATVSLDAYNASSAIDQLVKTNENSYAHAMIDSNASAQASMADVLNDALKPLVVNGISLHASAAHSAVNVHFGQAKATLSDVNSAASAISSLMNDYIQRDPVASAHSVVASAASSANAKAANLTGNYLSDMSNAVSSAAVQANTLIAMNPANSLLDSQLANDAASSMNSYVNMYEGAAANDATTSYAASAYAQIDVMDDEFKQLANHAVSTEVDKAKQAFVDNANEPDMIFANVKSAADSMKFLVGKYAAQNSNAVADAKQSFAADMDSIAGGVYSQARVLSINNRGQINSLTGSVANSANASVSVATTISSVAATYRRADALIGSVANVAVDFARGTAKAELANANQSADQALNTMEPNAKQAVIASIDTLMANVQARISMANNTVAIVDEVNRCVDQIKRTVSDALSANLRNIKAGYKEQILSAATNAYQGVSGLDANAQSLTNAAISMAASDANANIDQTAELAEIQMLTSAGIASINEASSVAVSNVKASGNSFIASAANSATGRTTTLAPVDKSLANSTISSLANVANAELNAARNVADASAAISTGTSAISSAIDSTIASVISSAMAMANNLSAQNERDSVRLQVKSAADAAYASTANLDSGAASVVNEYVSRTASIADRQITVAENEDDVNEIARSGIAALHSATNSAAGLYTENIRSSASSQVESAANSAFMLTDAFDEATRYSMNKSISQIVEGTKIELRGTSDSDRANKLVDLTIGSLNKLIRDNDFSKLDGTRASAKAKISVIANDVIESLAHLSAIAKQSATRSINAEIDTLNKRVNESNSSIEISNIVKGAKDKFEAQITSVNTNELRLSIKAAKQVLTSNADIAIGKLDHLSDQVHESGVSTIHELIDDAFKQIDAAKTVENITEINNKTSNDISRVAREAVLMDQKQSAFDASQNDSVEAPTPAEPSSASVDDNEPVVNAESDELGTAKQAAHNELEQIKQQSVTSLANVNEMVRDPAIETVSNFVDDALKQIDGATSVDQVNRAKNSTSMNVENMINESIKMSNNNFGTDIPEVINSQGPVSDAQSTATSSADSKPASAQPNVVIKSAQSREDAMADIQKAVDDQLAQISNINEVILEPTKDALQELVNDAKRQFDSTDDADQIQANKTKTIDDITHVVNEAKAMNDKMQ
ncbi:hypothetical protein [Nicoliella lavandulae]|uniref:Uncharacterized protein n=1 Tax=Nicoliella lavandulae TaxID=3082954 RepID=A0ABU8SIQ1_9LACO